MRLNPEINVGNLLTIVLMLIGAVGFFWKHLSALSAVANSLSALTESQGRLSTSQERLVAAQDRLVVDLTSIDKRLAIVETKIEERLPRLNERKD